jgi:hypothetical protein
MPGTESLVHNSSEIVQAARSYYPGGGKVG